MAPGVRFTLLSAPSHAASIFSFASGTQTVNGVGHLLGNTVDVAFGASVTGTQGLQGVMTNLINAGTLSASGASAQVAFTGGASGLNVSGGGTMSAAGGVNLTAGTLDLLFSGNQKFTGPAQLASTSGQVALGNGVSLQGLDGTSSVDFSGPTVSLGSGASVDFAGITGTVGSLNNAGSMTSSQGVSFTGANVNVSGGGSVSAATSISFSTNAASNGSVTFSGSQTLNGAPVTVSTTASGASGQVNVTGASTLVSAQGDGDLPAHHLDPVELHSHPRRPDPADFLEAVIALDDAAGDCDGNHGGVAEQSRCLVRPIAAS